MHALELANRSLLGLRSLPSHDHGIIFLFFNKNMDALKNVNDAEAVCIVYALYKINKKQKKIKKLSVVGGYIHST